MKTVTRILVCLCMIFCLAGCGREAENRVDTVVRIPVKPTESVQETQEATEAPEAPEETAIPTETPEPTEKKSSGGTGGSSGGKKPSGGRKPSGSGSKATEPPVTEPPATEPPETEMPETEPPTEEPAYDPSDYNVGSLEYAILDEINAHRREAGLTELSMGRKLCGIAALRAKEAAEVWSHTRPDGRSYKTALSDYGYGFGAAAENLAFAGGPGDAAAIVAEWMGASTRDNLLGAGFSTAGIGVFRSGGGIYVVNILVG